MHSEDDAAEVERLIEADDPAVRDLARAILDGTPVDWESAASGPAAAYLDELRQLAGLAAVQRNLTDPASVTDSPRPSRPPPAASIGQWGTLTLLEQIGEGAFGEVFRAWDPRLDREVALKLLHAADQSSVDDPLAAIEEGRLLARVRHPNVVVVHGAERIDGRVGVWTEFIRGRTLADWMLEHGPCNAKEALRIGIDLSRALAAVHDAGLLHRDIKPQNVVREESGRVVLMDFGAGKDRLQETMAGARELTGTPLYLAPELLQGATATPQSDCYSLGVLLYHLVTGNHPVGGAALDELREAHRAGTRRSLRDERPDLPGAFVEVVERAIASDAGERYESAAALEAALLQIEEDAQRASRRRRGWLRAGGLAVASGFAVYAVVWAIGPGAPTSESRRSIPSEVTGILGGLSRDGRYISYVDGENLDAWLVTVADGRARRVTNGAATGKHAEFSLPSPDGREVAYTWEPWKGNRKQELWMSYADGTNPRVLLTTDQADMSKPLQWSRDGTIILCQLWQKDGRRELALVSTTGRPLRALVAFTSGEPKAASLSPDDRFVVFDDFAGPSAVDRDVFIVGTSDPSSRRALLPHPAQDHSPLWTADGRVVHLSNRFRQIDAFAIQVENGVAVGDPVRVTRNMEGAAPVGLSDTGQMLYRQSISDAEAYTVTVDLDTPNSVGAPVPLPGKAFGQRTGATWSPDGAWLGYNNRADNSVEIIDLRNGSSRQLPVLLSALGNMPPRWSPDSRSVLIRASDRQNRGGYFQVHLPNGELTPALLAASPSESDTPPPPIAWSHDSTSVLYAPDGREVRSRNLSTGQDTVVVRKEDLPAPVARIAVSPEGRSLAMSGQRDQGKVNGLWVRTDAEPFREVLSVPEPLLLQEWTRDGRFLTYVRRHDLAKRLWHLWVLPLAGGSPRDLGLLPGYRPANAGVWVSHDGRRAAYTQGQISSQPWVMERFLPPVPRRAR